MATQPDFRSQIKSVVPLLREGQAREQRRATAAPRAEPSIDTREEFASAMVGVKSLMFAARAPSPPRASSNRPSPRPPYGIEEFVDRLSDGPTEPDDSHADEAASFRRNGIAASTLRKLRRRDWPIEAQLDLHGMTRDQARSNVQRFVQTATQKRLRCLQVVHGKGLGSARGTPVLRQKVRLWLTQCDSVLAFVSARPQDGGSGALLVLLKNS